MRYVARERGASKVGRERIPEIGGGRAIRMPQHIYKPGLLMDSVAE